MATTAFGTNDSQTVSLWSKMTMREGIRCTRLFRKFLGNDDRSIIQRYVDLEKAAGDTVKVDLLMQMKGSGVSGDNRLKDNEEALVYYQDEVKIDQLRNAHAFRKMSQQRTVHDLRKDASRNLGDWWGSILESYMFRRLCGDTSLTHGEASLAPDSGHVSYCGGQATEAAVVSNTEYITLDELDYAKEKAMMATPPMKPVRIEGDYYYVVVLHPYSVTDLKLNLGGSSVMKWVDIQQYANLRGLKNPIFTGALGVYNKMILFESDEIYSPITSCYRNLLLGAQAGAFALGNAYDKLDQSKFGKKNFMSWYEESDDYGNEKGIGCGGIFGINKNRFNSTDFAVMTIPSYSTSKR